MARPTKITEEVLSLAELATSRRLHKSAIKRLLREQYGLSSRSSERVMARVRERALERTKRDKADHVHDAYAFYDSVIRDSAAPLRLKILAQERIDKLLGLQASEKHEHSGPDGGPINVSDTILPSEEMDEILKDFYARKQGDGSEPTQTPSHG